MVGGSQDTPEQPGGDAETRRAQGERLCTSERRLRDAQRVAHVGSWEWEIASNRVTWSDEMSRIYGFDPGGPGFGGTYESFLERVHPDEREHTERMVLEAWRTRRPFTYDHRIVRPDGSVRMLHTRGDVVSDESGQPVLLLGSCWDITEKWEVERSLESSVSMLQAALESTADGLLVVDSYGAVVAWNQRLLQLWGVSEERVENANFEMLLGALHDQLENSDACLARVHEMAAQPSAESFDVLLFKDGRVFERYSRPQRIGEEIVGRVWSYRDVTDREGLLRRAVLLADASRLLGSLDVEAALEGVARLALPALGEACAVDLFGEDGGPRRLLSISRDPAHPIQVEVATSVCAGQAELRTVGQTSYLVVPVVAHDAVLGVLSFAAAPRRHHTHADLELVKELAARAALAIENARLYRHASESLAARDEFLSIAAHEIRGPVTSMHLAVQALLGAQVPAATRTRMLEVILREDRRVARFVDELLDVARVRSGALHLDRAPVDLAELTREVVARLALEVTRARSPLAVTTSGPAVGLWDRARLDQVVNNLLTNAIKFGAGKPIDVEVSTADGKARLVVRDQGVGIPVDRQQRIFEPFERAVSARHYGGLGLGLYIARRIVEGLGGSIRVQSQPEAGATFTVELPLGDEAP